MSNPAERFDIWCKKHKEVPDQYKWSLERVIEQVQQEQGLSGPDRGPDKRASALASAERGGQASEEPETLGQILAELAETERMVAWK